MHKKSIAALLMLLMLLCAACAAPEEETRVPAQAPPSEPDLGIFAPETDVPEQGLLAPDAAPGTEVTLPLTSGEHEPEVNVTASNGQDGSEQLKVTITDGSGNTQLIDAQNTTAGSDVDFDFTQMSATMVYAQVYDMMINADSYTGKTFRVEGTIAFVPLTAEEDIYFIVINDALGCCPQGIEIQFSGDVALPPMDSTIHIDATANQGMYEGQPYMYLQVETLHVPD